MRNVVAGEPYRLLTVKPLTGALGAELSGVDISAPLAPEARQEIRRALFEHLVIYFRDQPGFLRERHLQFAEMFWTLQKIPHLLSVDGYPPDEHASGR